MAGMSLLIAAALMMPPGNESGVPLMSSDAGDAPQAISGSDLDRRQVVTAQVLLDRARHSPGVIDGRMGSNTRRAIASYQRDRGMDPTGTLTGELMKHLGREHPGPVLTNYKIADGDLDQPFVEVPRGMARQAELNRAGYERPSEALAEKFHMAESLLTALNPDADFTRVGTSLVVVSPGDDALQTKVLRIEVDKGRSEVRAYAEGDKLIASYPATIGSKTFPSPVGTTEVRAVAPAPTYHFDPAGRTWGPDEQVTVPAGPNNPVGSTWIDLAKEGYGIHGTPEPTLIGKTASHGCVRLTNWDAAELGAAVVKGASVAFLPG